MAGPGRARQSARPDFHIQLNMIAHVNRDAINGYGVAILHGWSSPKRDSQDIIDWAFGPRVRFRSSLFRAAT